MSACGLLANPIILDNTLRNGENICAFWVHSKSVAVMMLSNSLPVIKAFPSSDEIFVLGNIAFFLKQQTLSLFLLCGHSFGTDSQAPEQAPSSSNQPGCSFNTALRPHRQYGQYRRPGRPPRISHSSWAPPRIHNYGDIRCRIPGLTRWNTNTPLIMSTTWRLQV